MLLLWNSYYLYFNIEWGWWYMPEPNKLYISLWAVTIWFTTGVLETSLKNRDTVCSNPRITEKFGQWIFKSLPASCSSIEHDNICDLLMGINVFRCSRNIVHIKVTYFSPPCAKWPWKSTIFNTSTGISFLRPICSIVELWK